MGRHARRLHQRADPRACRGSPHEPALHRRRRGQGGDLLFQVDPRPYQAALEQAEANLLQAQAQLSQAKAQVTASRAQVEQALAKVAQDEAQVKTRRGRPAPDGVGRRALHAAGRGRIGQPAGVRQCCPEQPRQPRRRGGRARRRAQRAGQRDAGAGGAREGSGGREDPRGEHRGRAGCARHREAQPRLHEGTRADHRRGGLPRREHRRLRRPERSESADDGVPGGSDLRGGPDQRAAGAQCVPAAASRPASAPGPAARADLAGRQRLSRGEGARSRSIDRST